MAMLVHARPPPRLTQRHAAAPRPRAPAAPARHAAAHSSARAGLQQQQQRLRREWTALLVRAASSAGGSGSDAAATSARASSGPATVSPDAAAADATTASTSGRLSAADIAERIAASRKRRAEQPVHSCPACAAPLSPRGVLRHVARCCPDLMADRGEWERVGGGGCWAAGWASCAAHPLPQVCARVRPCSTPRTSHACPRARARSCWPASHGPATPRPC